MFNSLKYAKVLERSGLPRKQAEAHIQILSNVMGEDVATKHDFAHLNKRIDDLESKMEKGFKFAADQREKLVHQLQLELQYQLLIKLGALITFLFTLATTVLSFTLS